MSLEIEAMALSAVPSEVLGLTRPGAGSAMKQWVSEARYGDGQEGLAWVARYDGKIVGWAAVFDGELSIYVKPSERRRGIGEALIFAIGDVSSLRALAHDKIGERFFRKHGVPQGERDGHP
jgi:GNAT superfamily N-acetyltransferase